MIDKSAILAPNVNSLHCSILKFFWKLFDRNFFGYIFPLDFQFATFTLHPCTPLIITDSDRNSYMEWLHSKVVCVIWISSSRALRDASTCHLKKEKNMHLALYFMADTLQKSFFPTLVENTKIAGNYATYGKGRV